MNIAPMTDVLTEDHLNALREVVSVGAEELASMPIRNEQLRTQIHSGTKDMVLKSNQVIDELSRHLVKGSAQAGGPREQATGSINAIEAVKFAVSQRDDIAKAFLQDWLAGDAARLRARWPSAFENKNQRP